ncbi:MAG TPA: type IV toxin-antitoxin system AbiEi family antitoxin domain-containing protein, partial [Solirubrobacteraceae bacterium]
MPEPLRFVPGNRVQSDEVRAIARDQLGIVGRAQLLAAGISRSAIGRALDAGKLHRVHLGVYATVAPELLTEEGHLVAALLAAGEGALLSHGTAAWRWRLIPAPPSMITL